MRSRILSFTLLFFILIVLILKLNKPTIFPKKPASTLVLDKYKNPLSARVSSDFQWRFNSINYSLSDKYTKSVMHFEDKYFMYHLGINPISILKAFWQNVKSQKKIRGGSTITMQLARLLLENKKRTYFNKCKEIFYAFWIEICYEKSDILLAYSQIAPFGGNIIGLEAASWRYFEKFSTSLSWSEAALFAILPNSPSRIYPGKKNEKLIQKRNQLLLKLKENKLISEQEFTISILEPIPISTIKTINQAPHALDFLLKNNKNGIIQTTIHDFIQHKSNEILEKEKLNLAANGVKNACILVLDVEKNEVLAYVGNMPNVSQQSQKDVDIIYAARSTGSILKPLLFSMCLNDGIYLPKTIVADIPTIIAGYAPKNFDLSYDGAVPFRNAIHRSLNVPSVRVLQEYGVEKFHYNLKKLGLKTLSKPASHYGLTLILGGAEATLWDICNVYAGMARSLNSFIKYQQYQKNDYDIAKIECQKSDTTSYKQQHYTQNTILSAGSIWHTFEAMNEVSRPDLEMGWQILNEAKIAWKTGTSFGNRDAWAVGCTPEYVVGVWVGNATGEGRANLTGVKNAAPLMFTVFNVLKPKKWFQCPENDLVKAKICKKSGMKANANCEQTEMDLIPKKGLETSLCNYCKTYFLDQSQKFLVNHSCASTNQMFQKNYFVLPPAMEMYFKIKNANYIRLPNWSEACKTNITIRKSFEIIYPLPYTKIFIPRELTNKKSKAVFQVAYKGNGKLFWFIDKKFVSETQVYHQLQVEPLLGNHVLTIEDEAGNSQSIPFEVIEKD